MKSLRACLLGKLQYGKPSVWEAVEKGQTDVVLEALRKGAGGITLDATDPHETAGKTVRMLTYADVCRRMLTYADVC